MQETSWDINFPEVCLLLYILSYTVFELQYLKNEIYVFEPLEKTVPPFPG